MSSQDETTYDFAGKYENQNPIARLLIDRFYRGIGKLVAQTSVGQALEVGCGEGFSTQRLRAFLPPATEFFACDIEDRLVSAARERNPGVTISRESIYELGAEANSYDLVICMEVLEHLDHPEKALAQLARVSGQWLVLSVPREPIWRALNMARGKYISGLGNTPGHIQHWSRRSFVEMVQRHAEVVAVETPLPWTQVLARVGSV